MRCVFVVATLVSASYGQLLWAQLPAAAINLGKVKISERQTSADLCPVHLVEADPALKSWTHDGVEYRGHTLSCQGEFEKAPEKFVEAARYRRWENNFIADMSTVWCPVTDEVSGGFLTWEKLGLKWESCCQFCNATVSDDHFPVALERLKMRARLAYGKTSGKYVEGAKSPLDGAILGRARSRASTEVLAPGEASEGLAPGLTLTVTSLDTALSDTRVARLAAMWVAAGGTPSPFLGPGPFRATWEGFLRLDYADELEFSAVGRGAIRLKIDGQNVLAGGGEDLAGIVSAKVSLDAGYHPFEFDYAARPSGAATIRLYWDGTDFLRETIPPTVFSHRPDEAGVIFGMQRRRGRELFASLRCVRCHVAQDEWSLTAESMPELHADAPSLAGIGSRLHTSWLARWISDPHAMRPDARMPNVLVPTGAAALEKVDPRAADIASYLATLTDPGATEAAQASRTPAAAAVAVRKGERLFSSIGCSACHVACDTATEGEDHALVSLSAVGSKWKRRALQAFLMAPQRHYQWTRMPDFKLSSEEAEQLTAYLLSATVQDETEPIPPRDPANGRRLVVALGCLNCHPLELENEFATKPLGDLEGLDWDLWGCVASGDGRGDAPVYEFTAEDRAALLAFGSTDLLSLGRAAAAEFANRQFRELRCAACHERDGNAADCPSAIAPTRAQAEDLQQTLLALATPPPLTYTGEQLRSSWLEDLLAGRVEYKVRPWLDVRMPSFPTQAEQLAAGLAAGHGIKPDEQLRAQAQRSPEVVKMGESLFGSEGGFSCSKCHSVGPRKAQMEVGFGVIDLIHSRQRLRDEFYLRWMMNPQRVLPKSQMPAYTDEGGGSSLTDILGGSGKRQFQAIWRYVESLEMVDNGRRSP